MLSVAMKMYICLCSSYAAPSWFDPAPAVSLRFLRFCLSCVAVACLCWFQDVGGLVSSSLLKTGRSLQTESGTG